MPDNSNKKLQLPYRTAKVHRGNRNLHTVLQCTGNLQLVQESYYTVPSAVALLSLQTNINPNKTERAPQDGQEILVFCYFIHHGLPKHYYYLFTAGLGCMWKV